MVSVVDVVYDVLCDRGLIERTPARMDENSGHCHAVWAALVEHGETYYRTGRGMIAFSERHLGAADLPVLVLPMPKEPK